MTTSPLFFALGPLLAALVLIFLSRWQRLTAGAGLLVTVSFGLLLRAEPGIREIIGSGELVWVLSAEIQSLFLILYAGWGLVLVLALVLGSGRKLVPLGLVILSLLLLALMVRPYLLAIFFLGGAVALTAVVVQDDRAGAVQGGLRTLVFLLLALPFLAVAGWIVVTQPAVTTMVPLRLSVLGAVILLAAFPFHMWVTLIMREATPLVWLFVLGVVQLGVTAFIFYWLENVIGVYPDPQLSQVILLAAGGTLVVALVLLATAVTVNRLLSGLLLVNITSVLLTLIFPAGDGWETAQALHFGRYFGLLLLTIGLWVWQREAGSFALQAVAEDQAGGSNAGIGRRQPVAWLLIVLGGFSLLGFPFTVGFTAQWALLQTVTALAAAIPFAWGVSLLLFLTMAVGAFRLLSSSRYFFTVPNREQPPAASGEAYWLQWGLLLILGAALWLGLFFSL